MLLKSSRYVSINISMTVDMFPQTRVTQKKEKCDKDVIPIISCHVECVVLMSRKDKQVPENGVFPGFFGSLDLTPDS